MPLFDRQRPRFPTPWRGPFLLVLTLVVLVLLSRGVRPPSLASRPSPPSSTSPQEEPRTPLITPPQRSSAEIEQNGCPRGCAEPPPGCDIKGNISQKTGERIYHAPGQHFYERTVISPEDGEAWFCTEDEARANGWSKAKL